MDKERKNEYLRVKVLLSGICVSLVRTSSAKSSTYHGDDLSQARPKSNEKYFESHLQRLNSL